MKHQPTMVNSIAPIGNVALMAELVDRVTERGMGLPGMAVFYGPSGYGKSTAAVYAANRCRAYVLQVKSAWSAKHLAMTLARETGIDAAGTLAALVDRIGEQLALSQRPLIVDEADFLVTNRKIEIVRDIYESSQGAVVLIGEETLPAKLERWERIHGRMLDWVAAQPASEADARHLAKLYLRGVEIEPALLDRLRRESGASARRISINLNHMREFARRRGLDKLTATEWGDQTFPDGRAPAARKH